MDGSSALALIWQLIHPRHTQRQRLRQLHSNFAPGLCCAH
uniref:Uncharacterized protein n=1 Tax=Arundo donax TaxID=35708 RepID=A0A0A9BZ55_ARUDO